MDEDIDSAGAALRGLAPGHASDDWFSDRGVAYSVAALRGLASEPVTEAVHTNLVSCSLPVIGLWLSTPPSPTGPSRPFRGARNDA